MKTESIIEALRFCYRSEIELNGCTDCPLCDMGMCTHGSGLLLAAADRLEELLEQQKGSPLSIKVKYFTDIPPLVKIDKGDWIDLRAACDLEIEAGKKYKIPLGVGMILPEGYEAHIRPRSSTIDNFGLLMACSGIIDNDYNGNDDQWFFSAVAMFDATIKKGDRICQFRIVKNMPDATLDTVENLNEVSRGGFGSTGRS